MLEPHTKCIVQDYEYNPLDQLLGYYASCKVVRQYLYKQVLRMLCASQ